MPGYHINDNGTWRRLIDMTVSGTTRVHQYWVNDLNVWRCIHNFIQVASASSSGLQQAKITFANDGQFLNRNTNSYNWSQYADIVNRFEIRFTLQSGDAPNLAGSSPLSTWLNLGTTRFWGQSTGLQDRECQHLVEIRDADSQVVLASVAGSLTAFGTSSN